MNNFSLNKIVPKHGIRFIALLVLSFCIWVSSSQAQQISGDTVACEHSYKTYTFPANPAYTYQWQVSTEGSPVYATADTFEVIWTVNTTGVIQLTEIDTNGNINIYTLDVELLNDPDPYIRPSWLSVCTEFVKNQFEGDDTIPTGSRPFIAREFFVSGGDCHIICEQTPITFYANGQTGSTFEWNVVGINLFTFDTLVWEGFDTLAWTNDSISLKWNDIGAAIITIKETTENGCIGYSVMCVQITSNPEAAFDITFYDADSSSADVCLGQGVLFQNTSSVNHSNDKVSWFVNGNLVATGDNASIDFNTPGTHEVAMVVKTQCNCADTAYATINVSDLPAADITCPGVLCEGDEETYSTNAVCNPYSWSVIGSNNYSVNDNSITIVWNEVPPSGYGQIILDGSTCDSICDAPSVINVPIILEEAEIKGPVELCQQGWQVNYSVPFWPGTHYQWSIVSQPTGGNNQLIHAHSNEVILDVDNAQAGTLVLHVEYYNELLECGGQAQIEISIKSAMMIDGDDHVICLGDSFTVSVVPDTSTAPYKWTILTFASTGGFHPPQVLNESGPVLTHSISEVGNYLIIAENPHHCGIAGKMVVVLNIPPPPFSISGPDSVCPGQYVMYSAQTTDPDYYIEWLIEDGFFNDTTVNQGSSIEHVFSGPPPYKVTAYQINKENPDCRSEGLTKEIWLDATLDFEIFGPDTVCANTVSHFSTDLDGEAIYNWTIQGGLGSLNGENSPNVEIQWNNLSNLPDSATIFLSVKACGIDYSIEKDVVIIAAPEPEIILDGDSCAGSTINFTAGGISSGTYHWTLLPEGLDSFPDQNSVNHTFFNPGSYTMHLEVENPNGCPVMTDASVSFTILPLPVANISIDSGQVIYYCVDSIDADVYVRLVRTGQVDSFYTYQWTQNGSPIAGTVNQETFVVDNNNIGIPLNQAGAVTYNLMVTDTNGCSSLSNSVTINLLSCDSITPCVSEPVTASPVFQRDCNSVEFSATVDQPQFHSGQLQWNVNYPSNNSNYQYSMNDPFTHEYETSGIYHIRTKIVFYENDGTDITDSSKTCYTDTISRIVVPLIPEFSYNFACDSTNQMQVTFTDISNYVAGYTNTTATLWEIVDIEDNNNLVYSGNTAGLPTTLPEGNYAITLQNTFNYNDSIEVIIGEICSVTDTIYVPGLPTVEIHVHSPQTCEGNTVHFGTTATGNITAWHWDYGDTTSSLLPDTSWHVYNFIGANPPNLYDDYTVFLTVSDAYGCQVFDSVAIRIHQDNFSQQIFGDSLACIGDVVELETIEHIGPPGNPQGLPEFSTPPVSWHWSTGDTTSSITVNSSDLYSVIMEDEFGCRDFAAFPVHFTGLPAATIEGENFYCYWEPIQLTAPQHVGAVTYHWEYSNDTLGGQWTSLGMNSYVFAEPWSIGWQPGLHHIRLIMQSNTAGGLLCPDTSAIFTFEILPPPPDPVIHIDYQCELPVNVFFENTHDFPGANWHWSSGQVNEDTISVAFPGLHGIAIIDSFGCGMHKTFQVNTLPIVKGMGMECVKVCDTAFYEPITIPTHIYTHHWEWLLDGNIIEQGSGHATITLPPGTQSGNYDLVISGHFPSGQVSVFCSDTLHYLQLEVETCCEDDLWAHFEFQEDTVCNNAWPLMEIGFNTDFVHFGIFIDNNFIGSHEISITDIGNEPGVTYDPATDFYTLPFMHDIDLSETTLTLFIIPHNGDSIGNALCVEDTLWATVHFKICHGCPALALIPRVKYIYNQGILEVTDISVAPFGYHVTEMWYNGQYFHGAPGSTAFFEMQDMFTCDTLVIHISHWEGDVCCIEADTIPICLTCPDIVAGSQTDISLDGNTWQIDYSMNYQPEFISWTFPDGSMYAGNVEIDPGLMSAEWTDWAGTGGEVCITTSIVIGDTTSPCGTPYTMCCIVTHCFPLGLTDEEACAGFAEQFSLIVDDFVEDPYTFAFSWGPEPFFGQENVNVYEVTWDFGDGSNLIYGQNTSIGYTYDCPEDTLNTTYYGNSSIVYTYTEFGVTYTCTYDEGFAVDIPACPLPAMLYPNPANSKVFIAFDKEMPQNASFTIYNSMGKPMYAQASVMHNVESIDIASWPAGVYLVSIRSHYGIHTLRFIKM